MREMPFKRSLSRLAVGAMLVAGLSLPAAADNAAGAPAAVTTVAAPAVQAATPDPTLSYSLQSGVTRKVLDNGLTVLVKEDHEQNTVALDLVARVGQSEETSSDNGITQLVGMLLQRKVSHASVKDDINIVEETGSDFHFNVTPDYSELALETTSEHFKPLLGRLIDAYKTRTFQPEDLNFARTELLQDLEGEQRVFKAIYDIFLENFYRTHPYREPQEGSPDAMRKLTLEGLDRFYDKWYVPNRTVIAVVGDVNTQDVIDSLSRLTASMTAVHDNVKDVQWEPIGTEKELQLSAGSNLAWIFLGYPAPGVKSPDYAAMRVMHALMGEGVSSRLWVDLREERGLAYELGSIYPALEGPGHFLAYMITTPQQLRESRKRMFAQMERLRDEDVPAAELEQARWKVIGQSLLQQETTSGKAFTLATTEAQGVGYEFTDRFLAAVRQVSPADVRRVANKYLENYTLIVARPPGAY